MARARNIKPGFFTNDELGDLSPLARLAFIGLWSQADFNGNMKCKPKRLKVEILPYDDVNFGGLIDELEMAGFVCRYQVDGENYLHVVNFQKHQRPHKNEVLRGTDVPQPGTEQPPTGTDPEQKSTVTEPERDENRSNPPDTGYRIPDTGYPQADTDKNNGSADADPARTPVPSKKFTDEDFEKFWTFCREHWFGKVGHKAEARKEFDKLRPEKDDLREILKLTRQECEYRRRVEAAEGFHENMKHVCRWIKVRGWEDVRERIESGPSLSVVQCGGRNKVRRQKIFPGSNPQLLEGEWIEDGYICREIAS
ncbi:hypothetical protein NLU14_08745 [Marinobacter sp. 71-i]|uniref:Phage replication protein n=1 Tax=Marinobacter iranensis TaxID=2962607 RepID=A0ABT5Y9G4_9GAMM|nr:hypothetical protein [Marinobacter iranensis]MDF0750317.1 hypothetical protein [Marinobacter iranensis]